MRSIEMSAYADLGRGVQRSGLRAGLRGWLLVYMAGMLAQALHALALTVASVAIYANPALAGLPSSVPLGSLLFYVGANLVLVVYTAVLFVLMLQRRKVAIVDNVVLNCLSVVFLVSWLFLGDKSLVGTIVDSLPGLVGLGYILTSKRVRATFVCSRRRGRAPAEPCPC